MPRALSFLGKAFLAAALAIGVRAYPVNAQNVDTTRGVRIGLTYTPGTRPGVLVLPVEGEHGDSIRAILQRDLDFGDRVTVVALEIAALDSLSDGSRNRFNFPLYARLGAAAVVRASSAPYGLRVAVFDVAKQSQARVKDFALDGEPLSSQWRLSLHSVADELEEWITGVRGIAATRILFTSGGRVWRVDSDGANATPLTPAEGAMSPAWHPKATHFVYTRMTDVGTQVVLREIGGPARVVSGEPQTVNATPVFSPDGTTILFAHGFDRGTDLYAASAFGSEPIRRVTVGRGTDNISPSFSPDGRRIVFTSNRPGHLELYVSDADGTNAEPLTPFNFGDQNYRSNPDWSPDGRLVAFQAQFEGRFQIVTINPRDRSMRRYTNEGVNEDPSWAPDSRHLVFTSNRSGSSQLWVLDIETNRVRQITRLPQGARGGAWSPRLVQ
jgi:TolB protein